MDVPTNAELDAEKVEIYLQQLTMGKDSAAQSQSLRGWHSRFGRSRPIGAILDVS